MPFDLAAIMQGPAAPIDRTPIDRTQSLPVSDWRPWSSSMTCDRACRSHIAPTAMRPIGRLATNPPDLSLMVLWCALYCVCCARRCRLHACSCSILKSGATDAQSSFWMSMIDEDSLCDGTGVLLVACGHPLRPHQVGIRAGRRAGRSAGMWAGMRVGKGSGRRWMVDAISRRSYYGSTGCGLPYA